jgi:ABC transporter substrate binding protein
LFAAKALITHGVNVSLYEQAPALGEVGAGVFLTPNSVRHLERVGLGPVVEKYGARVGPKSPYFRHDGSPIAPVQVTDSSGWNASFGMHRADLVALLAAALPAGVSIGRRRRQSVPGVGNPAGRLQVDVLVTRGTPAALVAKNAAGSIPVVMAVIRDPLGLGIVANFARPGGHVTGLNALPPNSPGSGSSCSGRCFLASNASRPC